MTKKHKVVCAVCGKVGTVLLGSGRKRGRGDWHFFMKVNANSMKTSKWLYEWARDKKGFMIGKDGLPISRRVRNEQYDPKARPKYVEYWECSDCYSGKGLKKS